MKLKPGKRKVEPKVEETPKRKSRKSTLPSDEYKPMFEPMRILVREEPSKQNPEDTIKQYLEISVKRFNDDAALPYVWITMYQESEFYTGYLKGKTIYLPLAKFYDFIDNLNDVCDECDRRGITE